VCSTSSRKGRSLSNPAQFKYGLAPSVLIDDDDFVAFSKDEDVLLDSEGEERLKWRMQRPLGAKRSDVWNSIEIYT
jgi:hypothetical protein